MSEANRPLQDEQPLAKPVHEQQLARQPVGGEQEEAGRAEEQQEVSPVGKEQEEKGLIDKIDEAIDTAVEKVLIDEDRDIPELPPEEAPPLIPGPGGAPPVIPREDAVPLPEQQEAKQPEGRQEERT